MTTLTNTVITKTATVTATKKQLSSIGIPQDGFYTSDLTNGSVVTIINENMYKHPTLGQICEVEHLYKDLNFQLPLIWLKMNY